MGTLVFSDIEGTLVAGNTARGFIRAGRARGLFPARRMALAQGYMVLMRLVPGRAADLRWRALLQLLAGQTREAVRETGVAGMDDIRPLIKPAMRARLAAHQQAGDTVVLLSGGLHDAAQVLAAEIGADSGEGTQPEVRDGIYTGRMRGPANQGPAKAQRAATIAAARGMPLAACTAYGDSGADIPLLASVGRAVAVDPDPVLAARARAQGWEIFRTVGPEGD